MTDRAASNQPSVTILGAGILGLWQALTLARAGFSVTVLERDDHAFATCASRHAGAMLAPGCEGEAAPAIVTELGRKSVGLWKKQYPDVIERGSLVLAASRDQADLRRFAKHTTNHQVLDAEALAALEPDLAGRFSNALYFPSEAHMTAPHAMNALLNASRSAGATFVFGAKSGQAAPTSLAITIDCRGMGARSDLPTLRGVRGERLIIRSRDVTLSRPVRLLHPRHPLYVVPWTKNRFMVGATVVESCDPSAITLRSALELLGTVYALHPGFAEAEILEMGAGVRPAFPDNIPRAIMNKTGDYIWVNGAYRHGFLLAPILADAVLEALTSQRDHPLLIKT